MTPIPEAARRLNRANRAKRIVDLVVAIPVAVLTLPLQAVIAAAVRVRLGRPAIFRHTRPGLHAEPFELLKFRTMLTEEQAGGQRSDAARLTPFGAWLRSTSLDELPSLWNIVRGDLSLVGPRPLLMHYLPHYSPEQARRHDVRPGLTGLAQVSGRNALTWEDRLLLDIEYVDGVSLAGDAAILARTVVSVLRREGISAQGEATMTPFVPYPASPPGSGRSAS